MTNYFIGIGGSGAKVLESLVHLCAAGMMPGTKNDELFVLDMDPDNGNGNLNRAKDLFDWYKNVTKLQFGETDLMKTKLDESQPVSYYFSPVDQGAKDLDTVVEAFKYEEEPLGKLFQVLYTKEERNTDLGIGFRGHPAIGAAVLAKNLRSNSNVSEEWTLFVNKVKTEAKTNKVRIFLAGSIFGGTGAAGVPNVAKLLRDIFAEAQVDNNVVIGGGLVLPYFSAEPTEEQRKETGMCVTSADFVPNTQAALKYYYLKMKSEPMYNSLYLIGSEDSSKKIGEFSAGAQSQKNDAHVVDLYTALAALDFFGRDPNPIDKPQCYYTGYDGDGVGWNDLPSPNGDKELDKRRFTQLLRFAMAYREIVCTSLPGLKDGSIPDYQYPWYKKFRKQGNFDLHDGSVVDFEKYIMAFLEWSRQIGVRNPGLIDANMFKEDWRIDWTRFTNGIGGEMSLDMNTINKRFSDYKCGDQQAKDFGQLLRVLYDSCKTAN